MTYAAIAISGLVYVASWLILSVAAGPAGSAALCTGVASVVTGAGATVKLVLG